MSSVKTVFVWAALSLATAISARASAAIDSVPPAIVTHLDLLVSEGSCEANWKDIVGQVGFVHAPLASDVELWLVPCAHWTLNVQWTAFLAINEPSRADGHLYNQVLFVTYDPYKKVHASVTADNVQFDSGSKTIFTRSYYQSGSECGSASELKFDSGLQLFTTWNLATTDTCRVGSSALVWRSLIAAGEPVGSVGRSGQ